MKMYMYVVGTSNEYPQHMFTWRNKKNISTFQASFFFFYLQVYGRFLEKLLSGGRNENENMK